MKDSSYSSRNTSKTVKPERRRSVLAILRRQQRRADLVCSEKFRSKNSSQKDSKRSRTNAKSQPSALLRNSGDLLSVTSVYFIDRTEPSNQSLNGLKMRAVLWPESNQKRSLSLKEAKRRTSATLGRSNYGLRITRLRRSRAISSC